MAKTNAPCLKAIYTQWENVYEELKDTEGRATKIELKEENESKEQVVKTDVEAALNIYEEKITELFKLSQAVPQLKIKLKDAGFNTDGSMNEVKRRRRMI